ncbi:hypothetical protein BDD12DRAFT_695 [Trichophaea hybrida]|nr:hypothetical protein BDD12DRAFT_695 [Trichophaea hybrida]
MAPHRHRRTFQDTKSRRCLYSIIPTSSTERYSPTISRVWHYDSYRPHYHRRHNHHHRGRRLKRYIARYCPLNSPLQGLDFSEITWNYASGGAGCPIQRSLLWYKMAAIGKEWELENSSSFNSLNLCRFPECKDGCDSDRSKRLEKVEDKRCIGLRRGWLDGLFYLC